MKIDEAGRHYAQMGLAARNWEFTSIYDRQGSWRYTPVRKLPKQKLGTYRPSYPIQP